MRREAGIVFLITLASAAGLAEPAYAYLDPGTGSTLLQLLLGGAVGVAAVIKLYWSRIRSIFSRDKAGRTPETGGTGQ